MRTMFYNNSSCLCVLYVAFFSQISYRLVTARNLASILGENQFYTKSDTYNAHRDRTLFYGFTNISIEEDVVSASAIYS
jgi:hypothetical protein